MGFALSVVVSESNSFLIIADFSVLVKQMESRIAFWENRLCKGRQKSNVINLKRPLNGKQNVWKYQNGEEKSDSDGREKGV